MSGFSRWTLESGRAAFLKGFGCRQAYESLGSPNPRATSMTYGEFGFWPARALVGTAVAGRILDADGLYLGRHDGLTSAASSAWGEVATPLMVICAGGIGTASTEAAEWGAAKPCRVTTPVSRVTAQQMAARGGGADVRRSRRRPCTRRSTDMPDECRPARPAHRPWPAVPPRAADGRG